ncbi:MAG: ATP-binding protein [Bryobacteraceae bacterium]|jgi:hypothetical protein
MDFQELAKQRHALQEFCQLHAASLLCFRSDRSFKLAITENDLTGPARHLTTTATCIESLLDCPSRYRVGVADPEELARGFAHDALARPGREWTSEGSAKIYCRCRALPLVVRHLASFDSRLRDHIVGIFQQLGKDPQRFAIGETAPPKRGSKKTDPASWYPPNAFHTYWVLELLDALRARFAKDCAGIEARLRLDARRRHMILWARHQLGVQVALHAAESSVLDTDQLGWSLAIVLKFGEDFHFDLAEQDLIRQAVRCLFQTQLPVGTWRHYRSLFHYRDAGNAYCYVFETFVVLLKIALSQKPSGQFFRQCLYGRAKDLIRLWEYAGLTPIRLLPDAPNLIGWCSGHRINQKEAEGWATASVFSFAQNLRRLVGMWTREVALAELPVRRPRIDGKQEALGQIGERGDTWPCDAPGVAEQLCTLFVHPILKAGEGDDSEPDAQPIGKQQARSAILFGPPGTSKTYLASCIAAAVGWKYIQVHASHFVARGLGEVQRTADEIFNRLMELDRAVVLFDEIDELVREREQEHDAFGRFLTTSMLPKVAELWEQRKIVYFVATNHIRYFDAAITRSQRFDALVFVGTPSCEAKLRHLKGCMNREITFGGMERLVQEQLTRAGCIGAEMKDKPLPDDMMLAKFALLRYDQLEELAHHLSKLQLDDDAARVEMMVKALKEIGDQRLRTYAPYVDFVRDIKYHRRDCQKIRTWLVEGLVQDEAYPEPIRKDNGRLWITTTSDDTPQPILPGFRTEIRTPGVVKFLKEE